MAEYPRLRPVMRHTYHVLTPLKRLENLERLIDMLQDKPVFWHPIFDEGLPFDVHFPHHWIQKGFCPRSAPFWSMWADSLNRFIHAGRLDADSRYLILNDDDFYEPDFFSKIDIVDGEVLICSMKRGQRIPPGVTPERAHGTDTLEAKPESMVVGRVGAEQMVAAGRVFERYGFNNSIAADGERIVRIIAENRVQYVPEAFVWFNYLEPGRWDT